MVPGAKAYSYKGKLANSEITDLSCPAPGYCIVVGDFLGDLSDTVAFRRGLVASQTAGSWGTAQVLPGLAKLDAGGGSRVPYVACSAASTCVVAGTFAPAFNTFDGFVATELPL
jgi:hypothetical protein